MTVTLYKLNSLAYSVFAFDTLIYFLPLGEQKLYMICMLRLVSLLS